MKITESKKGIVWGEVVKWIIALAVLLALILAILAPTREFFAQKLAEIGSVLKFGA